MMIHSLGYRTLTMPLSKALVKWKPCLLKNERLFYSAVWWFWGSCFRNFKFHFSSGKQQRTFGQGAALASPSILQMLGTETRLLQPWTRQGHAAKPSSSVFTASRCTHLVCPASESSWVTATRCMERLAFIVDGISVNLEQRGTRPLHSHICQREFLNTKRRNFADEQL